MSIADNLARVQEQMDAACRRAGRLPGSVALLGVSKTHPAASIVEAYAAGLRRFGENRVQEFAEKQAALSATGFFSGNAPATFHLIGPLQSNKATRAAQLFDAIDTVDSARLAEKLNQTAAAANKTLPILLEIKLSEEVTKHGLLPESAELALLLERAPEWTHLQVRGLMTVPPYSENLEATRPYFRRLSALRDRLAQKNSGLALTELSMGMSHDFSVAIEEGSTCVRIGTAIFGARPLQSQSLA